MDGPSGPERPTRGRQRRPPASCGVRPAVCPQVYLHPEGDGSGRAIGSSCPPLTTRSKGRRRVLLAVSAVRPPLFGRGSLMLVTVMIETLEAVANAEEIAVRAFPDGFRMTRAIRTRSSRSRVRQVLWQLRDPMLERLRAQRRHPHGAERPRARRLGAAGARRRCGPGRGAGRPRTRRQYPGA
jgi:hypothetical protein